MKLTLKAGLALLFLPTIVPAIASPPATKFVLIPLANIASCDATGRCIMEDSSPPSSQLFDSLDSCLEVVKQVYNYNQAVCVTAHGWAKTNPEWEKY